jgi:hypothetical protein
MPEWDASYGSAPEGPPRHDPFAAGDGDITLSEAEVLDALVAFLAGRHWMPSRLDFEVAGHQALWQAMTHYASAGQWAGRLGIARRRPADQPNLPASKMPPRTVTTGRVQRLRTKLAPTTSTASFARYAPESTSAKAQETDHVTDLNESQAAVLKARRAWNQARPGQQSSPVADPTAAPHPFRATRPAGAPRQTNPFRA